MSRTTTTLLLLVAILSHLAVGAKPLHTIRAKEIKKPDIKKPPSNVEKIRASVEQCDAVLTETKDGIYSRPLMAGQHYSVGKVTVKQTNSTHLNIKYEMEPDPEGSLWYLTEIHYSITPSTSSDANPLPPPPGSAPGQYEFKEEGLCTQTYSKDHQLSDLELDECPYFAFHAVVERGYVDFEEMAERLPGRIMMRLTLGNAEAYWMAELWGVSGEETILDTNGIAHYDWCVDMDHYIAIGSVHEADVYSSYQDLTDVLPGPDWYTENLPQVNWIINQNFLEKDSDKDGSNCNKGPYTMGDIQKAIWQLLENDTHGIYYGSWDQDRINCILNQAVNHSDFKPSCGGVMAVILDPVDEPQITISQVTIAEIAIETCHTEQEETAWAQGKCEFGPGWGSYFQGCLSK